MICQHLTKHRVTWVPDDDVLEEVVEVVGHSLRLPVYLIDNYFQGLSDIISSIT